MELLEKWYMEKNSLKAKLITNRKHIYENISDQFREFFHQVPTDRNARKKSLGFRNGRKDRIGRI